MSQDLKSFTASDRYSLCKAYVYLCGLFPKPSPSWPVIHADGQSGEDSASFSASSPASSYSSYATPSATSSPSPASPSSLESPAFPNATLPPASQDLSRVATASATSESRNSSPSPDLPSYPRSAYTDAVLQPKLEDAFMEVQHMPQPQPMPPTSYLTPYEEMTVFASASLGKRRADNTAWYPSKRMKTEDVRMPKQVLLTALPKAGLSRFPGIDEGDEGHALNPYNHRSGAAALIEQFHEDGLAPNNLQLSDRGPFPWPPSQATWLTEEWAWNGVPQMSCAPQSASYDYQQIFNAIVPASHDGQEGHYDVPETIQSMPQMYEAGFNAARRMFEAEESESELETYEGQRSLYAFQENQYGIQQTFCGSQQALFNETETASDVQQMPYDNQSNFLRIFGDESETFYPSIQSVLDGALLNGAQENGYDALPIHQDASQFFANIGPTSRAAEHTNGDVAQFEVAQFMQDALHPFEGVPQGDAEALPIVVPPPPGPRRNQTPYLSGEHNCHPCCLGFNARGDLARHEGTAKHDRRMRQLNPNAESQLRLALCDVCGGTFANPYTVSKHKETQHVESA